MELNLPPYDVKISVRADGVRCIFDRLRKKFVAITPEEWVRQHFVNFLITRRGYPEGLMANEVSIRQNGCLRRSDTVVYDRNASPMAVVEYKAPEVAVTAKVFDQIVRYNMVLGVKWLMVSNGMSHYCCLCLPGGKYQFVKDIPPYTSLYNPTYDQLRAGAQT